jgi:hypothetical protein
MANVENPTTTHTQGQQRTGTGIGETVRQTVSGVGEAAGQMKEKVQDAASTVSHRVGEAWDSAYSGARQGVQAVADTAEDFWTGTTRLIRRYPVASVLIAFGAGCLAASLFRVPNWNDDVARRMSRSSM